MNRRKLFQKLFGAGLILVLAPKIAFGRLESERVIKPEWKDANYEVFVWFKNKDIVQVGPPPKDVDIKNFVDTKNYKYYIFKDNKVIRT